MSGNVRVLRGLFFFVFEFVYAPKMSTKVNIFMGWQNSPKNFINILINNGFIGKNNCYKWIKYGK